VAGFARLELGAKVDNIASQRAAEAGGFRREGISRRRLRNPDGSFSDEVVYARFAVNQPAE
jgi:RimJ/RimL family protein N-acetyltransferase